MGQSLICFLLSELELGVDEAVSYEELGEVARGEVCGEACGFLLG